MKINFVYCLVLILFVMLGCQKEVSFETGNQSSDGSLQSEISGDCLPKTINGTYEAAKVLVPATNTIVVGVTVVKPGAYIISTDTVNGYFFRATGTFTTAGSNNITLRGTGTPFAAGVNNFVVSYDSTVCDIQVTVFPAGAGGPAVFTLAGAPNACTSATINGTYINGVTLNTSNNIIINVNVTTIGTYNITTTFKGMTFAASGVFSATGATTITLAGSGTPTTTGSNIVPITVGATTCSCTINVLPPLSNDYFPRTTNSNWSYEFDDVATDSIFEKVIPQTITALGNPFNIFMQSSNINAVPPFDTLGYYRKSGGDYYQWVDINDLIGFDNPPQQWVEYIMLKDNQPMGNNWKSAPFTGTVTAPPAPVQTFTVRFSYTILEKDVTKTVITSKGTNSFNNVIVVKEEFEQLVGATWVPLTSTIGYGKSYYAKGIGLIKYEALDPSNTVVFLQELRRFEVY